MQPAANVPLHMSPAKNFSYPCHKEIKQCLKHKPKHGKSDKSGSKRPITDRAQSKRARGQRAHLQYLIATIVCN